MKNMGKKSKAKDDKDKDKDSEEQPIVCDRWSKAWSEAVPPAWVLKILRRGDINYHCLSEETQKAVKLLGFKPKDEDEKVSASDSTEDLSIKEKVKA